ncbi:MAG: nitroreductase family protein [Candidatus Wallbacteria bacterium]
MEALEAIFTRKSIRKYTEEKISEELMKKILGAAMCAPSAGNEQPWHFVVVDNHELLVKITKVHPFSHMLKNAPAAILVCGDKALEKYEGFWIQDCSAAAQNILIAAHAAGLGAVWLGVYPVEDRVKNLRKLFNMPENITPMALISLGHPAEARPVESRFNEERIHKNSWQS